MVARTTDSIYLLLGPVQDKDNDAAARRYLARRSMRAGSASTLRKAARAQRIAAGAAWTPRRRSKSEALFLELLKRGVPLQSAQQLAA